MKSWLINHNKHGSCIENHFNPYFGINSSVDTSHPWMWNSQTLALDSYLVSTWSLLHTQYLHFEVFITILVLKIKMSKFGKNTLKSPKIVLTKYNFLHFKNLTRCVYQIWWKYCELWKFWKFWNLMYLIFQKYSIRNEYFVCNDILGPK